MNNILNEIRNSRDRIESDENYCAVVYVHPEDTDEVIERVTRMYEGSYNVNRKQLTLFTGGIIKLRTFGELGINPEDNANMVKMCVAGMQFTDIFVCQDAFGKYDDNLDYKGITRTDLVLPFLLSRLRTTCSVYPRLVMC